MCSHAIPGHDARVLPQKAPCPYPNLAGTVTLSCEVRCSNCLRVRQHWPNQHSSWLCKWSWKPGIMAEMGRSTILALVVALFCQMTQYAQGKSYNFPDLWTMRNAPYGSGVV